MPGYIFYYKGEFFLLQNNIHQKNIMHVLKEITIMIFFNELMHFDTCFLSRAKDIEFIRNKNKNSLRIYSEISIIV